MEINIRKTYAINILEVYKIFKLHIGHFRPFRPSCDHLFLFFIVFSHPSMLWMITKNDLHQFSHFFENFSGRHGRNYGDMKAVIDSSEIYTINFFIKKKI